MLLKVHQAEKDEVHTDTIRLHKSDRKTKKGESIKSGTICKITVIENGTHIYGILRGLKNKESSSIIYIDEPLRDSLKINDGEKYNFNFQIANYFGRLCWMWNTTDIGYRVSAQLAIISFGLAVLLEIIIPLFKLFICKI